MGETKVDRTLSVFEHRQIQKNDPYHMQLTYGKGTSIAYGMFTEVDKFINDFYEFLLQNKDIKAILGTSPNPRWYEKREKISSQVDALLEKRLQLKKYGNSNTGKFLKELFSKNEIKKDFVLMIANRLARYRAKRLSSRYAKEFLWFAHRNARDVLKKWSPRFERKSKAAISKLQSFKEAVSRVGKTEPVPSKPPAQITPEMPARETIPRQNGGPPTIDSPDEPAPEKTMPRAKTTKDGVVKTVIKGIKKFFRW